MSKFKYRVRYTRKSNNSAAMPCTEDVIGVSAISALGAFHRQMQLHIQSPDSGKTILRPKLAPEDYSIVSMALIYNTDTKGFCKGEWIESAFDLPPNSKNPDVRPQAPEQEEAEMGFMSGLVAGRLAK